MREQARDRGRLQDMVEAANNVAEAVIVKMRHVIVHGYAKVSPEILWDTAVNDVPQLKVQIEEFLSE